MLPMTQMPTKKASAEFAKADGAASEEAVAEAGASAEVTKVAQATSEAAAEAGIESVEVSQDCSKDIAAAWDHESSGVYPHAEQHLEGLNL